MQVAFAAAVGIGALWLLRKRWRRPSGQLWGSPLTTCSRRAIAACTEAGVDWTFVPIHLAKGEHKQPAYLEMQPYGKVPAWREADGFQLFESRAIMKHVCEGTALVPSDARSRALMEQWLSVEYSAFYPSFIPIYYMRVLKKMPLDEAQCAKHVAELEFTLNLMESQLQTSTHLAGEDFSIADLSFLCYFEVFEATGLQGTIDARPTLKAWWARCRARPSWVYTMSASYVAERAPESDPLGRAKPWDP